MPAKSKKQQMAAGAALAAKRGKRSKSSLKGASRKMAKSIERFRENETRQTAGEKEKLTWISKEELSLSLPSVEFLICR